MDFTARKTAIFPVRWQGLPEEACLELHFQRAGFRLCFEILHCNQNMQMGSLSEGLCAFILTAVLWSRRSFGTQRRQLGLRCRCLTTIGRDLDDLLPLFARCTFVARCDCDVARF